MGTFSDKNFQESLQALPETPGYLVAYSGGMDSHVLLHAMCALPRGPGVELRVIHVNHGLSENAGQWQDHCQHVSAMLGLDFTAVSVQLQDGSSLEARARALRYEAIAAHLQPGHILLTAHHMDDQAETLLLQLFRGAGPDGLASMPLLKKFANGWLARPLLAFCRADLHGYALEKKLDWVEDDTNQDPGINRNFLRHRIMPELSSRWPGLVEVLYRSAAHQSDSSRLQDALGDIDLQTTLTGSQSSIDLDHLRNLSEARQRNVIRFWLKSMSLPVPGSKLLEQLFQDMLNAAEDSSPVINCGEKEIRRYRNRLYIHDPVTLNAPLENITWDLREPVVLGLGCLKASQHRGHGLKASLCKGGQVMIRYRQGGESIRLPGKTHHQSLKNMFQQAGVPPWYRDQIPLLYLGNDLAAVCGKWIDAKYCAAEGEESWCIDWDKQDQVFGSPD